MASSSDFRARAVMHPRHFSHILNWFRTEYPNCTITMPALERPTVVDTTLRLETGAGMLAGRFARYDRLILEHGFPLDAARRVRFMMGAAFEDIESSDDRVALLMGLTLGLEAATSRSAGGFNIGVETMIGGGLLGRPEELTTSGVAVFEAGAHLGYAGPRFEIGLAGRVGVPLSGPDASNPYLLAGIRFGYNFYLP